MKKILIATALMASSSVMAASFDCSLAGTPVEKLICSDSFTSQLDSDLNTVYNQMANKPVEDQRAWIKNVRNKQVDVDGLNYVYASRIEELANLNLGYTQDRIEERQAEASVVVESAPVVEEIASEVVESTPVETMDQMVDRVTTDVAQQMYDRTKDYFREPVRTEKTLEDYDHPNDWFYSTFQPKEKATDELSFVNRVKFEYFKLKLRIQIWWNSL